MCEPNEFETLNPYEPSIGHPFAFVVDCMIDGLFEQGML